MPLLPKASIVQGGDAAMMKGLQMPGQMILKKLEFTSVLMGKVHFEVAFDSFDRGIEIAKFYIRKFFMDQFHKLFYTHTFAGFSYTNLAEIPVRINIKISPLNHAKVCLPDQLS